LTCIEERGIVLVTTLCLRPPEGVDENNK